MKRFNFTTGMARALLLVGVVTFAVGTGATVCASQEREDRDDERPITGIALVRASAAALRHTGGGRVTGTEIGDEEGYYEVEVTLDDGRQVDVHLNEKFEVIGQENDVEGPDDDDGDGPEDDDKPNPG